MEERITEQSPIRILIVNNNMHIGGVQKALVNLLKEIVDSYEVTLLLFYPEGELLSDIPHGVHIVSAAPVFRPCGMTSSDVKNLPELVVRSLCAAVTRVLGRKWLARFQSLFQKKLKGYDVAVSFLHSGNDHAFYGGCNEFVLNCIEARKKVCFIHCDYEKINADSAYNRKVYSKFDVIAACSSGSRASFLNVNPFLDKKTAVVHNCHDYSMIHSMAALSNPIVDSGKLNVVSVCRFGKEKGILRALRAISELGSAIQGLHYYLIGDGIEYAEAESLISALGLEDTVSLLGEMINPYGYLKIADLLLIPSFSEAAPMVIGESACLGTPVLTTRTCSSVEMVECPGYGWICENSEKGILEGLQYIMSNPEKLQMQREALTHMHFDNRQALDEFASVIKSV